jgi:hypothetical protein
MATVYRLIGLDISVYQPESTENGVMRNVDLEVSEKWHEQVTPRRERLCP